MRSLRLARERHQQHSDPHTSIARRNHVKYKSFQESRVGESLINTTTLENIKAQREALDLALEVVDLLYNTAITSRGKDIDDISELMDGIDEMLQISRAIQKKLHDFFDPILAAPPTEYYWETVKAVDPLFEKGPELKALPEMEPLSGNTSVKMFQHEKCGGYFYLIGKAKAKFPMFYCLCDRCGEGYWTR